MAPVADAGGVRMGAIRWLWDNRTWIFSGIGVLAIAGIARWLSARRAKKASTAAPDDVRAFFEKRKRPLELEILPHYFELNLAADVPEIRVYLYAVNYLDSPVK